MLATNTGARHALSSDKQQKLTPGLGRKALEEAVIVNLPCTLVVGSDVLIRRIC